MVGLYLDPPVGAVVLSIDEKTQVQALDRTQPVLPIDFAKTEKRTHDYVRHGTTNLFAALDTATGEVLGECYPRRRTKEARSRVGEPAGTLRFRISRYGTTSHSAKPFKLRLT